MSKNLLVLCNGSERVILAGEIFVIQCIIITQKRRKQETWCMFSVHILSKRLIALTKWCIPRKTEL